MKKIILLTDFYYPKPFANGVCIHQIANSLIKLDYQVHVVCFRQQNEDKEGFYDGVYVHRVEPSFFHKMMDYSERNKYSIIRKVLILCGGVLHRLKKIILVLVYPLESPLAVYRYYLRVKEVSYKYDVFNILAQYNPIEAVAAALLIKKKNKKVKSIIYVVDSFTNSLEAKKYKLIEIAGWLWEKRLYNASDLIINMNFHQKHHMQKIYDTFRSKMIYLGLPLVKKPTNNLMDNVVKKDNFINCVYAGAISIRLRNPEYLCKIFSRYNKDIICMNFYSRGNGYDILKKYERLPNSSIKNHDYLPSNEIIKVINSADILISIGNKGTEMVPSKIFEYISYCKPIIHFYKDDNDSSLPYLRLYPLSLCVKESEADIDINTDLIFDFILKNSSNRVLFSSIEDKFIINTPEYSANKIHSFLYAD